MNESKSKNIYKNSKGKFVVQHSHYGGSYGTFESLSVAEEFVKICFDFGWDRKRLKKERIKLLINSSNPNRYITESYGKFNVVKSFRDKGLLSYGRFESLEEAREHRDFCVEHDWDESCRRVLYNRGKKKLNEKYISMSGGKFLVSKNFGNRLERFDLCDTLEQAIECRDFWVSVCWDWDCVDLS